MTSPAGQFRGPLDAIVRTYRREGVRALYGGFGAVIIGGTPGTVLYLTSYAFFRDSISSAVLKWNGGDAIICSGKNDKPPSLSHMQEFAVHFASGMLAETVTCIVYVPVDVVKERMQVQQKLEYATSCNLRKSEASQSHQYKGSWDALHQIIRTEGMRGIYKGYFATLASFGPFSALYFVFYERCKLWSREHINRQRQSTDWKQNEDTRIIVEDGDLPLLYLIACSAGAGALASWLTSPLDMAKLRLQVQRGRAAAAIPKEGQTIAKQTVVQYRNMMHCLLLAYKDGGVRGLFRGAGARVLHFTPATTITLTCYEKCRTFYANVLG